MPKTTVSHESDSLAKKCHHTRTSSSALPDMFLSLCFCTWMFTTSRCPLGFFPGPGYPLAKALPCLIKLILELTVTDKCLKCLSQPEKVLVTFSSSPVSALIAVLVLGGSKCSPALLASSSFTICHQSYLASTACQESHTATLWFYVSQQTAVH